MAIKRIATEKRKGEGRFVPVVGIGGAAGAQQAITDLIANVSVQTGFAFIYIQSLHPDFEGDLADVLRGVTTMKVQLAKPGLIVQPNEVYILNDGQDLVIADGIFTAPLQSAEPQIYMPVDQFLISLSEGQNEAAVGVVLSGSQSDGTIGLKAIKVAGGITFAQDESAPFQNMPRSAISEGVVDMILSPRNIALELDRLGQRSDELHLTGEPLLDEDSENDEDEDLRAIIQFMRKAVAMDFAHYKITTIRRRIVRRMLLYKLETLKEYSQYLKQHPSEATVLYNDLLINVTSFFRDPETMDFVRKTVLPQIIKTKLPREQIRIWIPACSTGEEAYSYAIMLLETLGERGPSTPIQIFATDLSEAGVAKARQGTYSKSELAGLSAARIQRFFTPVDDHFRINKFVRDLCIFAPHNVFKDPPFSRLDLVSCRNLLIYVDTSLQRKAISTFHYSLNPSGFLILGRSETVGTSASLFTQLEKNHKIYTRRNDVTNRPSFETSARAPENEQQEQPHAQTGKHPAPLTDIEKIVDNLLLTHFAPPSVVVNQDLEILQFRGAVSLFLEPSPGRASLNLLKMARPSLVFDLRSIIHKSRKSNQRVKKTGLEIKVDEKTHHITIEAVPINFNSEERLFLVLFEEISAAEQASSKSSISRDLRIKELEAELALVREDLHSIIEEQEASNEELQSANEEIVSSNEELQSMNEELETSKEEIESANEELMTINQELLVRNDQLSEAYNFSDAIFGTIRQATLILDKDLRVKSANGAYYKSFGEKQEETEGKLVYELGSRQWNVPKFRKLLEDIISDDIQIEDYEIPYTFSDLGRRILKINARRVIRQERQPAILLAIEDITEQMHVKRLLEQREAWFRDIADNAPMLTWVADTEGHYNFLNKAWLSFTGKTMEQEIEAGLANGIHPDDRKTYIARYVENFKARKPFRSEYRLRRHDGEYCWISENAQPIYFAPDGSFTGFMGSCADIHSQKILNQELDRRVLERTRQLDEANRELRESEQKLSLSASSLQAVLDNSPAAIAYLKAVRDQQHTISDVKLIVCNDKFADLSGFSMSELLLLSVENLGHMLWGSETVGRITDVIETGEPFIEEREIDGDWIALALVRQDDGVVLTGQNISALKNSEQHQRDLITQIEASSETIKTLEYIRHYVHQRGAFLRTTTHDLRSSFGIISGAASLLNLLGTEADKDRVYEMLQRNLRQVTHTITQLLDYSRLESGQERLQVVRFNATDAITELCESLNSMAHAKGLTLSFAGEPGLLVEGDVVKVRRIAQNLLLNAIKYTQEGQVKVTWGQSRATEWFFKIVNTGSGLSDEILEKLNKPVSANLSSELPPAQNQSNGKDLSAGEGVGLFIVKRLCEILGAHITATSDVTLGTSFTITLPSVYED